ncbi:MAG: glycoside hydrolase family 43 protein [Thermoguttaceae bacterium]|nr:glycoside hydrolase family 43 protein [Thermoguttaceae bacterium]
MNRRDFQRCLFGGASFAAFGGRLTAASGADSAQLTYRNPQGNAADPSILRKPTGEVVEYDGRYWLYYTSESGNVRGFEARSTRDFTSWQDEGLVFDAKGTWARDAFWAPEGYEIDGKYYLFFSAQNAPYPWTQAEKFNIGVAVADSPRGPFKLLKDEPIFDPGWPIIDANLFIDDDGTPYLTFSRCCYQHAVESELAEKCRREKKYDEIEESWAYGIELKKDFSGVVGEPTLLIRPPVKLDDKQSEWESRSVTAGEVNRRWTEGTALFKLGDTYYIAYSANFFGGDWYAVGYATAKKPLGPYTKAANNPILEKNTQNGGTVRGVGHGNIFFSPDRSEAYYVYHARTDTNDRKLFIDKMIINGDGSIAIDGPSVDPRPVPSFVKPK